MRLINRQLKRCSAIFLTGLLVACGQADFGTLSGAQGKFSDWRGHWVVINYWAEWCKPCIEEIPELNALHRQTGQPLLVYGVNFDGGDPQRQLDQAKRLSIEFPVLSQDPAPALGWERPVALPTTFIIDPEGRISARLQGPQTLASLNAAITPPANTE